MFKKKKSHGQCVQPHAFPTVHMFSTAHAGCAQLNPRVTSFSGSQCACMCLLLLLVFVLFFLQPGTSHALQWFATCVARLNWCTLLCCTIKTQGPRLYCSARLLLSSRAAWMRFPPPRLNVRSSSVRRSVFIKRGLLSALPLDPSFHSNCCVPAVSHGDATQRYGALVDLNTSGSAAACERSLSSSSVNLLCPVNLCRFVQAADARIWSQL